MVNVTDLPLTDTSWIFGSLQIALPQLSANSARLPVSTLFLSMFLLNVHFYFGQVSRNIVISVTWIGTYYLKGFKVAIRWWFCITVLSLMLLLLFITLLFGWAKIIVVQMIFNVYVDFTVCFRSWILILILQQRLTLKLSQCRIIVLNPIAIKPNERRKSFDKFLTYTVKYQLSYKL